MVQASGPVPPYAIVDYIPQSENKNLAPDLQFFWVQIRICSELFHDKTQEMLAVHNMKVKNLKNRPGIQKTPCLLRESLWRQKIH